MTRISLNISGASESAKRIEAMVDSLENLTPMLSHIGEELLDSTRQRFRGMVDPEGSRWEPISEKTRKRKKRNKDKTLIDSGDLMNLMRYQVKGGTLEVGSDRIYAATHQFGRGPIPERAFLGISDGDEKAIISIVMEHLSD